MLFGKKKSKNESAGALRETMDAILDGLTAPVEVAPSPDGKRLRALLRRAPYLALELELPGIARILSPTKEEVIPLPQKSEEEFDRLRALLQQYLSIESDAASPAAAEHTYRLKVSVLSDFTYLPRWEELGHTDVKIGGGNGNPADGSPTGDENDN